MQKPFQVHVDSKYGAPMGRRSTPVVDIAAQGKAHLQRVPSVDGDYDQGGAYWGGIDGSRMLGNSRLYCLWNGAGANYFRAYDREYAIHLAAKAGAKLLRNY